MKMVFIIIESLLISLAFTSKVYLFENGEEKKIYLEKGFNHYFFVEGVSQNQHIKLTIITSDNKYIPFESGSYNYVGVGIKEYDKNNDLNSESFYKLDISNENDYYKIYTSKEVFYYNTTRVGFNLTANYTENIFVKLEYGGSTNDIEKGKEYTYFNLTALYPYNFFVNATDGEIINAEVEIYDLDDETKIQYSFNLYEERYSPNRNMHTLKTSSVVKEKDYLKWNFTHYINHDFGLNVKYVDFRIFPSVDIGEIKIKLNTEKKDKDKDNDKSNDNDKGNDKSNDGKNEEKKEEKNSSSLFIIIVIIILIVIILIVVFIFIRLKASKNTKDIYSLNIEAPSTPLTPQNQNNYAQQPQGYPQYIGLNSPQSIPPQEMYVNPIQPIEDNNNMNYMKPSQIYQ